jgi:hypothetical protein
MVIALTPIKAIVLLLGIQVLLQLRIPADAIIAEGVCTVIALTVFGR